jgi:outer membrane receptor for ferrienterochelin and colicin
MLKSLIHFALFCTILFGAAIGSSLQTVQAQTKLAGQVQGQTPDGLVEPLPFARVWWADRPTEGAICDEEGRFSIGSPPLWPSRLVVSSVNYALDTFTLNGPEGLASIRLTRLHQTKAIEIDAQRRTTNVSSLETIQTERLQQGEFRKAACCNLSESFETNATVDVAYADPVSGLKEIQMLGLSGRFVQILVDNQPAIRGLGTAWGLTFIPGPWVHALALNKGTGSVINGYESMAGQINIGMKSPETADALYLKLYINQNLRQEGNLVVSRRLSDTWATALLLHASRLPTRVDMNGDRFADAPQSELLTAQNSWRFDAGSVEGQFGLTLTQDQRQGGHIDFNSKKAQLEQPVYGFDQQTRRAQAWSKTGLMFSPDGSHSLGLQTQWTLHTQTAQYGWKAYQGDERAVHLNLIYQRPLDSTKHALRTGMSYLYDEIEQTFNDSLMPRLEHVPGAFAEYTWAPNSHWTWVAGLRADHHSLYGAWITPRLNGRYSPHDQWTFRAGGGRGRRVPNPLIEQPTLLSSGRLVVFQETLQPEDAWNGGFGLQHTFQLFGKSGTLLIDYFHTNFLNRTVADFDSNDTLIVLRNLNGGTSRSNALQLEVHYDLSKRLQGRMAYKYLDVQTTTGGQLRPEPLLSPHRGFFNLAYKLNRWEFDLTLHVFGPQRMPVSQREDNWGLPRQAPSYALLNAHVNYTWKKWSFFVGAENLTDVMQRQAFRSPESALTPAFDTQTVWGPLMGRVLYAGLHFSLPYWNDRKPKSCSSQE